MHRRLSLVPGSSTAKLGVAAVTVTVACCCVAHNKDRLVDFRPRWNRTLIEAVSGAAGEVAQIALVYPLDTVKVRCQAGGLNSRQVIANLWAATGGSWPAFLSALYAGALPAAALSILVGSVHYCCFCATRRALVNITSTNSSSSSSKLTAEGQLPEQQHQQQTQHVIVSHGATGTHFLPIEELSCDGELLNTSSSSSRHDAAAAAASTLAATDAAAEQHSMSQDVAEGSLLVNCTSAVITAALTALVESPLELFRHNSQAGQIQGSFLPEMWRVLRKSGPRSLYYGLIPYCFESWPYDISELLVVGAAKDFRQHPAVRHMAPAAYDLTVGGLAGTVAVLVSMPFDVVKTYIQTHGAVGTAATAASTASTSSLRSSLSSSAGAFWSTGKTLVARGGPGALFVGLAPRLAHQVPGAMICWLVIETCHRVLTERCLEHNSSHATMAVAGPQKNPN